jgi:hypothetical protein
MILRTDSRAGKISGIMLMALLALSLPACHSYVAEPAQEEAPAHDIAALPALPDTATVIASADLYKSYAADRAAADRLYKGKTICVQGAVKIIHDDAFGGMFITLQIGAGAAFDHILCRTASDSAFHDLAKGQVVAVRGICVGPVLGNIQLKNCVFFSRK